MKKIIRFIVGLAAPFILVFSGAGLIGYGIENEYETLAWIGLVVTVCGLIWGFWLYFLADSAIWWD